MLKHPMALRAFFAPDAGGAAGGGAPPGQPPAGAPPAGAEHPATAPWSGSQDVWKIGEGDKAQPWYSSIPEEPVRELMKVKNYKNPAELAMAYHNANKMINGSGDVVVMPKADAKPEEWNAFYTKLGRPESPDKYEFKHPDGTKPDEGLVKLGKELFFDMGATPAKAQAALDKWEKFVAESNAARVEQERVENDSQIKALETKWGDQLEANKAAGNRAVKALGIDAALIEKIEANIGSAAIVELLAAIGRKSDEGGFKGGGNNNGDPNDVSTMSKEQASAKIVELRGNAEFDKKFTDSKHPEHAAAVALMERLFAKAG